jgi:hypothetical protein
VFSVVPSIALILLIVLNVNLIDVSIFDYFLNSIIFELMNILINNNIFNLFFGNGPKFTTSIIQVSSEAYGVDVGIFRVLMESGIFIFIGLILIILYYINRFLLMQQLEKYEKLPYMVLFFVMLSSIHTNLIITPPFYPLFGLCLAGILQKQKPVPKGLNP